MNVLFVHQNFPGQFRSIAPALAERGHRVVAITMNAHARTAGVEIVKSVASHSTHTNGHPWSKDIDTKVIRGEATFRAAMELRQSGFAPDLIVAHPGWGESMFLKVVWPGAVIAIYCEFFYEGQGADIGFDPEFPVDGAEALQCQLLLKNFSNMLHFEMAAGGISPTAWQASTFPRPFRERIVTIHDGIDTARVRPNPSVGLRLNEQLTLTRRDEIITFVNRNLEPYRGYHVFMRALPELLRRRPNARVLIVGGDSVSYGPAEPNGRTWREVFLQEVQDEIDPSRVHFLGKLTYDKFLALLAVSTVHIYLTYPFVLSWSLLEAMATECAIVASDTAPVVEVIEHGETGLLTPFFDRSALIEAVDTLLGDPAHRARLGRRAREVVVERYDLKRVCLPRQLAWLDSLVQERGLTI